MSQKFYIDASQLFEPVDINLWGTQFRLREVTRSVEDRVGDIQKKINKVSQATRIKQEELIKAVENEETVDIEGEAEKLEASSKKKIVPLLIEMISVALQPLRETERDGERVMVPIPDEEITKDTVTAADVINGLLKDDKIGVAHIEALSKKLNETALEARPS